MHNLQRTAALPLKITALVVISLFASLLVIHSLNAQSSPEKVSISVSPQSLDTAINAGQSITNVFRITNEGDQAFLVEPTPKNFVPNGNEGAIKLEDDDTPYSLAKWIKVNPSGPISIEPRQTADFNVTITVPTGADPGGHFGSVVFRTLPTNQPGTAAQISQEIAPVILVRVPGDVKEEISVTRFRALNAPITSQAPVTFETIVKNSGSVHVKPSGTIAITNMFGKQVASTEIQGNNVIPGAERKMNGVWEDPGFRFGRYTARLTMVYGNGNQIITDQTSFFVVPLKQIVPAILIIALLGFVIYRMRRRLLLAMKILAGKQEPK